MTNASDKHSENRKMDRKLDEALEQTFPASDPVSIGNSSTEPEGKVDRKPAPIDGELVKKLARKVGQKQSAKSE